MPSKFLEILYKIKGAEVDLVIVIGTSLAVNPFNTLVDIVSLECPKVLINMENTKPQGYDFNSRSFPERLFLKGKCDDIVGKIIDSCGWSDQINYAKKHSSGEAEEPAHRLVEELGLVGDK